MGFVLLVVARNKVFQRKAHMGSLSENKKFFFFLNWLSKESRCNSETFWGKPRWDEESNLNLIFRFLSWREPALEVWRSEVTSCISQFPFCWVYFYPLLVFRGRRQVAGKQVRSKKKKKRLMGHKERSCIMKPCQFLTRHPPSRINPSNQLGNKRFPTWVWDFGQGKALGVILLMDGFMSLVQYRDHGLILG